MAKNKSNEISIKNALGMGIGTILLSFILSLVSEVSFRVVPLSVSILLVLVVILIGILFDMVGMATVTADLKVLHARASQKVHGARVAVELVRNSARVSSICNDVVGDICGTLSGALGATIVIEVLIQNPNINGLILGVSVTSMVASLTVGGKAYGKGVAIKNGTPIIFFIGKLLSKAKL